MERSKSTAGAETQSYFGPIFTPLTYSKSYQILHIGHNWLQIAIHSKKFKNQLNSYNIDKNTEFAIMPTGKVIGTLEKD